MIYRSVYPSCATFRLKILPLQGCNSACLQNKGMGAVVVKSVSSDFSNRSKLPETILPKAEGDTGDFWLYHSHIIRVTLHTGSNHNRCWAETQWKQKVSWQYGCYVIIVILQPRRCKLDSRLQQTNADARILAPTLLKAARGKEGGRDQPHLCSNNLLWEYVPKTIKKEDFFCAPSRKQTLERNINLYKEQQFSFFQQKSSASTQH